MSVLSGKDFLNVLEMSNYDVSSLLNQNFDWLFQCEHTSEFMQWMCQYVGAENMLKEDELKEYDEWVASNIVDENHPHDSLDDESHPCETHLENLNCEILSFDELNVCLIEYQAMLRSKLNPEEELLDRVQQHKVLALRELKMVQADCAKLCKELDSVRSKVVDAIDRSGSCFLGVHNSIDNLGHVSLANFKKEVESCTHLINTIVRKQIYEIMTYLEEDRELLFMQQLFFSNNCNIEFVFGQNEKTFKRSLNELIFIQKSLTEIKLNNILALIEEKADLSAIDMLKVLTAHISDGQFHLSQTQLKYQLKEFTQVLSILEEQNGELVAELYNGNEHNCQSYVMQALVNESRVIEVVQESSLARMKMLANHVAMQIQHSDLMWLLFAYEKNKVEEITELSDMYYLNTKDSFDQLTERREIMKLIQEEYNGDKSDSLYYQKNLFKPLEHLFNHGINVPVNEFPYSLCHFKSDIASQEQQFFNVLKESKRIINENLKSCNQLKNFVLSGPTKKPVLIPTPLSVELHQIQARADGFDVTIHDILNDFSERKDLNMKKPSLSEKRLLWVYFLVRSEMLGQLLQNLQKEVKKGTAVVGGRYD